MSAKKAVEVDAVVIGAGPAGASAAIRLKRDGVPRVLVLERADCIGGVPSRYTEDGVRTFLRLPMPGLVTGAAYARCVERDLRASGAEVRLESTVLSVDLEARALQVLSPDQGRYEVKAKAIVFACGAREQSAVEHGWIFGKRPARVYNSMPMLDLMRRGLKPHTAKAVLVGSQPAAYSMAAKLAKSRTSGEDCAMVDHASGCSTPFPMRLYFAMWSRPHRSVVETRMEIRGDRAVEAIAEIPGEHEAIPAQYVLLPGNLVPNSELLAVAGVKVAFPSWRVEESALRDLERRGIFLCGNIRGGENGAHIACAQAAHTAGTAAEFVRSRA
jgi:NADPH-dependent 2,4-dienoyl-CoA reductase/sulfur reductase-like enzyme